MVRILASHLFRRHIPHCTQDYAWVSDTNKGRRLGIVSSSDALGLQFREAEVENLDCAVLSDEQAFGLQVAMDDAFVVGRALGPSLRGIDFFHSLPCFP